MLRAGPWCARLITPRNMFFKRGKGQGTGDGGRNTICLFIFLQFLILNSAFLIAQTACNCDESKIAFSESYINSHQLVFRGKTVSLENGEDYAIAHFSVSQLFKGSCPKEITIYYDKKNECNLKIGAGEDWLIYANFKQLQKPFVEYCSRSRKNVINTNKNVERQYIKSDLSVDAECQKLQEQLGLHNFSAQMPDDNRHRNVIPTFWQRIILILLSIAGFIVIYFLLNKFLKK